MGDGMDYPFALFSELFSISFKHKEATSMERGLLPRLQNTYLHALSSFDHVVVNMYIRRRKDKHGRTKQMDIILIVCSHSGRPHSEVSSKTSDQPNVCSCLCYPDPSVCICSRVLHITTRQRLQRVVAHIGIKFLPQPPWRDRFSSDPRRWPSAEYANPIKGAARPGAFLICAMMYHCARFTACWAAPAAIEGRSAGVLGPWLL